MSEALPRSASALQSSPSEFGGSERLPSFFLALLAAAATTLAGRESVRVARLSVALGAGISLLTACWLACAIGCGLAAWLGTRIAEQLAPEAKAMLVAIALLLAACELALLRPRRAPAEPTRSFGAIVLVLGAAQLTGAAGFLVLALAAVAPLPELSAFGGTLGAGAALTAAWSMGREWEARVPIALFRWTVATLLLLAAAITGLSARGLLG
jgi:hypothetical protein